jgi:hypothetical protein
LTTFHNVPPVLPVRLQGRDAPVVPITFNTKISEKPIWKIVVHKKISKLPGHTSCLGFQLHKHSKTSCSAQDNRKELWARWWIHKCFDWEAENWYLDFILQVLIGVTLWKPKPWGPSTWKSWLSIPLQATVHESYLQWTFHEALQVVGGYWWGSHNPQDCWSAERNNAHVVGGLPYRWTSIQMSKKACWWAGIPFGSFPYFGFILVAPYSIQNLCTCFEHLSHKRLLQPR